MIGDVQGADVGSYLRLRMNEEKFDAFCVDCQNNRSSHCNVTFGTFVCDDCAKIHEATFAQFQCYIKPLFFDAWDAFQINCVRVGGNQRFFEYMRGYGKDKVEIAKKYDNYVASFYRKRLAAEAKGQPFDQLEPAKTNTEYASRKLESTQQFFTETNQKY